MRIRLALLFFFLIVNIRLASAEEIGAFFIGIDHFLSGHEYPYGTSTFSMNDNGVAFGFLLPIHLPRLDSHYKVRVVFRDGVETNNGEDQSYLSATNALLLGSRFGLGESRWDILPQIGLGSTVEDIYAKWGHGYVYYVLFVDLSLRIDYQANAYGVGFMVNLESAVYTQYVDADTDYRLDLSLLLWK